MGSEISRNCRGFLQAPGGILEEFKMRELETGLGFASLFSDRLKPVLQEAEVDFNCGVDRYGLAVLFTWCEFPLLDGFDGFLV